MSEETRRQKAAEAERLAAALRENLRRRKQQARARRQTESDSGQVVDQAIERDGSDGAAAMQSGHRAGDPTDFGG